MKKHLAIEDDTIVSTVDINNVDEGILTEEIGEVIGDELLEADRIERSCVVLESLADLYESLQSKKELTASDHSLIRIATEMAVAGTSSEAKQVVSLEGITDPSIAMESIMDTLRNSVLGIGSSVSAYFKREVDHTQAFWTFFELQSNTILDLKSKLADVKIPDGKVVAINGSKYLRYDGKTEVTSLKEYQKQFETVTKFLVGFNRETNKIAEKDLFQTFKNFFSPITGYDEKYMEMFGYFNDFVTAVKKLETVQKKASSGGVEVYKSDSLLGQSHLYMTAPSKDSYNSNDMLSCKRVAKNIYVAFRRDEKFEMTLLNSKVRFDDIDKSKLSSILKDCEAIVESYRDLLRIRNKISAMGARWIPHDFVMGGIANPVSFLRLVLANYRLMMYISTSIYTTMNGGLVFSRGNVKQATEIVARSIK